MTGTARLLSGIDGGNLLGVLAALGLLRILSRHEPGLRPRLAWQVQEGAWRPQLVMQYKLSDEELITMLDAALKAMVAHPAWTFANDLNVSAQVYRDYARSAAMAVPEEPLQAEFAAAFACDAVTDASGKKDIVSDTALRTMSGAGHQHFLGFMRQLAECTGPEHLRKALFEPWRYDDDKPSMRWDPLDDRRYALRWNEPSGDPIRTVRGANRLAIEALPLFPVMPRGRRLETTGFSLGGSRVTYIYWPIWRCPIPLPVVRSLLADRRLSDPSKHRGPLRAIGVELVYRSQRLTVDKYRNFTAGVPQ